RNLLLAGWGRDLALCEYQRRRQHGVAGIRNFGGVQRLGGKVPCGGAVSRNLFFQRWNHLDATGECKSAGHRTEFYKLSFDCDEPADMSYLSSGVGGGARTP